MKTKLKRKQKTRPWTTDKIAICARIDPVLADRINNASRDQRMSVGKMITVALIKYLTEECDKQ